MRIGITQRVVVEPCLGERRDCLDQMWTKLLEPCGWDIVPVPNQLVNIKGWATRQALDGLILSGGNDLACLPGAKNIAPERDFSEKALLNWAEKKYLPVLGVCRGMQMINLYHGGSLSIIRGHVACKHPVQGSSAGGDLSSLLAAYTEVNSFHNWGVFPKGLANTLQARLYSLDGSVEAFEHQTLPWVGIMWHPERENTGGATLDLSLLKAIFNKKQEYV